MSRMRALSSPELDFPESSSAARNPEDKKPLEDTGFECVATNAKLLLKLVQDHNEASLRHQDNWKTQRVNTMMTILDDLKSRIQKTHQSSGKKELRRCFTDLKPNHQIKNQGKPQNESPRPPDEIQKLRKELDASLAARKSLQMMCSSMGKEKEIMARELARKAQELTEMEDLLGDIRAQNEKLSQKVQACAAEHKEKKGGAGQENGVLKARNRELSDQLLKSIDGYKSLKRRYKDVKDENAEMRRMLRDLAEDVKAGSETLHELQDKVTRTNDETEMNLEDEILALESLFQEISTAISKNGHK
ncbi:PREDICTED: non-neuronal cytoplasmic intermediate filament protein [Tarenaya hassleriana]|uniref:non-neuronal cytoplasmic intermediate filament protein n=1 Tax=Tarenaya hassleriana TaxID=28532 RepID=UPI00053C38A3|nr:PREDICTED: non-neuronal cytoplasmic intermediate filament protein [Tarenaya hassleriana]